MTIEERALGKFPKPDEGKKDLWLDERRAYVAGANDQQKIDIEKACELYEEALCKAKRTGIHGIPQMVQMFKQAMEE